MIKKIIDISWPISAAMTAYKDRKIVSFTERKNLHKDGAAETTIVLDAHSGTHVDAPSHFISGGNTIDATPLSSLLGECLVINCGGQQKITADFLQDFEIEPHMIVLFKTDNSTRSTTDLFNSLFVYVDASAATFLLKKQCKAIGIDYLGIERDQPLHETHVLLLNGGIPIIEGLRLAHVAQGRYEFICLPLAVQGIEAAPARAVLIER